MRKKVKKFCLILSLCGALLVPYWNGTYADLSVEYGSADNQVQTALNLVELVSLFWESDPLLSVAVAGVSLLEALLDELLDFWEAGVKSDGIFPAAFHESIY